MGKGYERSWRKSSRLNRWKFEVIDGRKVRMWLPLPMAEVWEELQAGLKIVRTISEDEVRQKVGTRYQPDPAGGVRRWGSEPGYVVFGGQKVSLDRPRVGRCEGGEVDLESYRKLGSLFHLIRPVGMPMETSMWWSGSPKGA
jgi:hypothetical protein